MSLWYSPLLVDNVSLPPPAKSSCLALQQKEMELAFELAGAGTEELYIDKKEQSLAVCKEARQTLQGQMNEKTPDEQSLWITIDNVLHQELSTILPFLEKRRSAKDGTVDINLGGPRFQRIGQLGDMLLKRISAPAIRRHIWKMQCAEDKEMEKRLVELLNVRTR